MRRKIGGVVIVLLSTLFLAACAFLRSAGPCYGYGCHGFAQPASSPATAAVPPSREGKAVAKAGKPAPRQIKQGS